MTTVFIDGLAALHGGGQTYLTNLLRRLPAGEPQQVHVLAQRGFGGRLAGDRIRVVNASWRVENPFIRAAWQELFVRRQARQAGASVVFSPGGMVPITPLPGCRRATMFRNVIPFDPEQRARYPRGYPRIRNWLLERLHLRSMLAADLVIFPSRYGRSLIERRAGRPLAHAITIPHGVGPEFRRADVPTRPDWLPETPYVLYVSSFEPYKMQAEVVRAFSAVRRDWRDPLSLVLAGPDGMPYATTVRREIRRLGLGDRVIVSGNRPHDELPSLYHHALFCVFASAA
jgi:glycosyltransferase involved in cell wall biosynthesis